MDAVRYFIALFLIVAFPAAMSMWFLIHPLAGFWRRRGPTITYASVVALAAVIGLLVFRFREPLLRVEFGFSWVLTAGAILCYLGGGLLEWQYRKHLTVATLLGLPEVSESRPSELLTEGIYSRIRHPRYIGLMCELSGTALFVNYLAVYVLVLATVPVLYLTVRLEERELVERFGEAYERYMAEVPRFLPRVRQPGRDSEV
jgi:protein-S-isoprenylcysteine O-methyltransferase Ste14